MNDHYKLSHLLGIPNIKDKLMTRHMEMKCYLRALLNRESPSVNSFVIFGLLRTGSHLLADLLNSHPDIICEYEIFVPFIHSRAKIIFPKLYMKGRFPRGKASNYGCILKLYQLSRTLTILHRNPKHFIVNLSENGWKMIHLKRLNVFRLAISNMTAQIRGQWNDYPNKAFKHSKVTIDCDTLINSMTWFENELAKEEKYLEKTPHITISYENNLLNTKDHQGTSDMIFEFLGLYSVPVKAISKRVSTDSLSDNIKNYEEVVRVVSKTKYAKFLEQL